MSDNGLQFTSVEVDVFLKSNSVWHICSAPYHPQSNGEVERFVQTFKNALKTAKQDEGSVQTKLSRFLLSYRTTPNATTGLTLSELFLKRDRIQTRSDLLKPRVEVHVENKQASQKKHRRSKMRSFDIGQKKCASLVEPSHNETPAVEDGPPPVVSEPEHIADQVSPRYPRSEHVPPDRLSHHF